MLQQRIKEVTVANQKFYEAFESLDIARMDDVWAHQDYVTCIHPGWTIRSGWPAVRDSWGLDLQQHLLHEVRAHRRDGAGGGGHRLGDLCRKPDHSAVR